MQDPTIGSFYIPDCRFILQPKPTSGMSLPRTITAIVLLLAATQISAAASSTDHTNVSYTHSVDASSMIMPTITFYESRADLDAACGATFPIEDFAGLADNAFMTCGSPVNSTNSNCLPAGSLNAGFNILGDGDFGHSGDVYLSGTGNFGLPNPAIGGNSGNEPTNITFDSPVTSVGFDAYAVPVISSIQLDLLDASGVVIETRTISQVPGSGKFVGITSSTPFSAVRLKSQAKGTFEFISNLSFGTCTNVASNIPTMGQWALFILGMILTSLALVYIRVQSLKTN